MEESSLVLIKDDYTCIEIVHSENIRKLCDGIMEAIYRYRQAEFMMFKTRVPYEVAIRDKNTFLNNLEDFVNRAKYRSIFCAWNFSVSGVLPKESVPHVVSNLRIFQSKMVKYLNTEQSSLLGKMIYLLTQQKDYKFITTVYFTPKVLTLRSIRGTILRTTEHGCEKTRLFSNCIPCAVEDRVRKANELVNQSNQEESLCDEDDYCPCEDESDCESL